MHHVCGHADKYLLEAKMSPSQQVNFWADKLATAALIAAVEANEFIQKETHVLTDTFLHYGLHMY